MEEKAYYELRVYNTCTEAYEIVTVEEAVFNEYRRSEWNISKRDSKFFQHEIVISAMKGAEDETAVEHFKEFTDTVPEHMPEAAIEKHEILDELKQALDYLSEQEQGLIKAVFYDGKSLRQYAEEKGISHTAANKRKRAILQKLRELLQ